MPISYTESTNRIIAQLHNARKMAIARQNRRLAMDVLKACSLYVQGTRFPFDHRIIEGLAASIIDKRDTAIMEEFAKVEKAILEGAQKASKAGSRRPWRTIRLPTR